jgi:hypothetical protein
MALYTTYNQVGKAEDVSDIISNISPTKVPFSSSLRSEKVKARNFEWQEDSLRSVQENAQKEGFTAVDATLTPTLIRQNYTQILEKTVKVSNTADVISTYGRAKESAYQLSKAGEELSRDLEHAFVGVDQALDNGNDDTIRRMASYYQMIDPATTVAGAGALTEEDLVSCHQQLYDEGADATIFMIKPSDSIIVAGFAGSAGRNRTINDGYKTIVNAVDLYVSPFGELKVVLNRFIKPTNAILYDPDNWRKVVLRPWSRTTLALDGDNVKMMIVGEYSLKHVNWKASGTINGLTSVATAPASN